MPGLSGRPSTVAPTAWAAGLSSGAVVVIGVLGALALSGSPLPSGSDAAAGWRPDAVQVLAPAVDPLPDAGLSRPVRPQPQRDRGSASVPALPVVDDRRELVQRRALPTGVLSASLDAPPTAPPATRAPSVAVPDRPDVRPGTAAPTPPAPPPHAHTQGRPPHAGVPDRPAHAAAPAAPKAHGAKASGRAGPAKAVKRATSVKPATKAAKPATRATPAKPATKAGKRATRATPATPARPASNAKPSADRSSSPQAVRAARPGHTDRAATSEPGHKPSHESAGKGSSGPKR